MNKRRLLKLAALLEADAKNKNGIRFDLNGWGHADVGSKPSASCGTMACAIGLAVVSGVFKKDGLENRFKRDGIMPMFCGHLEFDAVNLFFDLEPDQSGRLFLCESYPPSQHRGAKGERAVAKRIRALVAGEATS